MTVQIKDLGLQFPQALTPIRTVTKLIQHHPAMLNVSVRDIHNSHIKHRQFNGVGYNFLIEKDGTIVKGRGYHVGAQTKNWNSKSLGICYLGNFEIEHPTEEQYLSGAKLNAMLIQKYGLQINDVAGHNKFDNTLCPGKNFKMDKLHSLILKELNGKSELEQIVEVIKKGEVDMTLRKGDRGAEVKKLQSDLKKLGYKIDVDDIFGSGTASVVRAFQRQYGLGVDGIAGKNTLGKIAELLKPKTTVKESVEFVLNGKKYRIQEV